MFYSFINKFPIFFLISFCLFISSCNELPSDLQKRKDYCNTLTEDLAEKEKNANNSSDYNQLIIDYSNLLSEIEGYTKECNDRGISKNNDKIIKEINLKIDKYEELVNSTESIDDEEITYKSNDGNETWIPDGYSKGSDCSDCNGTGYYTHDILGSPNSEGGVCAGCNGRGYRLDKN